MVEEEIIKLKTQQDFAQYVFTLGFVGSYFDSDNEIKIIVFVWLCF